MEDSKRTSSRQPTIDYTMTRNQNFMQFQPFKDNLNMPISSQPKQQIWRKSNRLKSFISTTKESSCLKPMGETDRFTLDQPSQMKMTTGRADEFKPETSRITFIGDQVNLSQLVLYGTQNRKSRTPGRFDTLKTVSISSRMKSMIQNQYEDPSPLVDDAKVTSTVQGFFKDRKLYSKQAPRRTELGGSTLRQLARPAGTAEQPYRPGRMMTDLNYTAGPPTSKTGLHPQFRTGTPRLGTPATTTQQYDLETATATIPVARTGAYQQSDEGSLPSPSGSPMKTHQGMFSDSLQNSIGSPSRLANESQTVYEATAQTHIKKLPEMYEFFKKAKQKRNITNQEFNFMHGPVLDSKIAEKQSVVKEARFFFFKDRRCTTVEPSQVESPIRSIMRGGTVLQGGSPTAVGTPHTTLATTQGTPRIASLTMPIPTAPTAPTPTQNQREASSSRTGCEGQPPLNTSSYGPNTSKLLTKLTKRQRDFKMHKEIALQSETGPQFQIEMSHLDKTQRRPDLKHTFLYLTAEEKRFQVGQQFRPKFIENLPEDVKPKDLHLDPIQITMDRLDERYCTHNLKKSKERVVGMVNEHQDMLRAQAEAKRKLRAKRRGRTQVVKGGIKGRKKSIFEPPITADTLVAHSIVDSGSRTVTESQIPKTGENSKCGTPVASMGQCVISIEQADDDSSPRDQPQPQLNQPSLEVTGKKDTLSMQADQIPTFKTMQNSRRESVRVSRRESTRVTPRLTEQQPDASENSYQPSQSIGLIDGGKKKSTDTAASVTNANSQPEVPLTKYHISQTPKQLIAFLDKNKKQRRDSLTVQIVSDAILGGHDFDAYRADVDHFIKSRLQYKYQERSSFVNGLIQEIHTHAFNCGLQRLDEMRETEFIKFSEERPMGVQKTKQMLEMKKEALRSPRFYEIKTDCVHNEVPERDAIQKLYDQYKTYFKFKENFKVLIHRHFPRKETVKYMLEHIYQMKDLTPDEEEIFSDPNKVAEILLHPLAALVKVDLAEEREAAALGDTQLRKSVKADFIDNENKKKWNYVVKPGERYPSSFPKYSDHFDPTTVLRDRFYYSLNSEGQKYLDDLAAIFQKEKDDAKAEAAAKEASKWLHSHQSDAAGANQTVQTLPSEHTIQTRYSRKSIVATAAPKIKQINRQSSVVDPHHLHAALMAQQQQQTTAMENIEEKYANLFQTFRRCLSMEDHYKTHFKVDAKIHVPDDSEIQDRLNRSRSEFGERVKFSDFKQLLILFLERYYEEVVNAPPPKKAPIRPGAVVPPPAIKIKVPAGVESNVRMRNGQLQQKFEDAFLDQEHDSQLFTEEVLKRKFFSYINSCEKEITRNSDQERFLEAFKTYRDNQATPWPVIKKIKNQRLVLSEEFKLTLLDTYVIKGFLEQSLDSPALCVRHLEIKNCPLSDQMLAYILEGISKQNSISSIVLINQIFNTISIEPLVKIIEKKPPHALNELQMIGCKQISASVVQRLFQQLEVESNLTKLTLSKFQVFTGASSHGSSPGLDHFLNYLSELNQRSDSSLVLHTLTHLDLSYAGLTPYEMSCIMENLEAQKHLQFFSLAGNRLDENLKNRKQTSHLHYFNQSLRKFIASTSDVLVHLDLSEMIWLSSERQRASICLAISQVREFTVAIELEELLKCITKNCEALEVFHFDRNCLSHSQKMELITNLGETKIRKPKVIRQFFDGFRTSHEEVEFLQILKQNSVDPMLCLQNPERTARGDEGTIQKKRIKRELEKLTTEEKKQDTSLAEPLSNLPSSLLNSNSFTLVREMYHDSQEIRYTLKEANHSGEQFGQPLFLMEPFVKDKPELHIATDGGSQKVEELCQYCKKLQHFQLYFLKDSQVPSGYTEITDIRLIEKFKKYLLLIHSSVAILNHRESVRRPEMKNLRLKKPDELYPLVFGSLTGWKVIEMIPTEIYTLNLLKEKLLAWMGSSLQDPFNRKNFSTYFNKLFNARKRRKYWERLLKEIPADFLKGLHFYQENFMVEYMRELHLFDQPPADYNGRSFVFQGRALPGKHSFYVYLPQEDKIYCRNLILDTTRGQSHTGLSTRMPVLSKFEHEYDPFKYDLFLEQKLDRERNAKAALLQDLAPEKIKILTGIKKITIAQLEKLLYNYNKINDLFLTMSANSTEMLTCGPQTDQSEKFYPHVSTVQVSEFFNRAIPPKKMFIDRHQFFQYILKQILKETDVLSNLDPRKNQFDSQDNLEASRVHPLDLYKDLTMFRDFVETKIDLKTQHWLKINAPVLKEMFSKHALDSTFFYNEGKPEDDSGAQQLSFRSLGYLSLKWLKTTLKISTYGQVVKLRAAIGLNPECFSQLEILSFGQSKAKARNEEIQKRELDKTDQRIREKLFYEERAQQEREKQGKQGRPQLEKLETPLPKQIEETISAAENSQLRAGEASTASKRNMKGSYTGRKTREKNETPLRFAPVITNTEEAVLTKKDKKLIEFQQKIKDRYQYSRQRFFNVDFLEFLQVFIIQAVLYDFEATKIKPAVQALQKKLNGGDDLLPATRQGSVLASSDREREPMRTEPGSAASTVKKSISPRTSKPSLHITYEQILRELEEQKKLPVFELPKTNIYKALEKYLDHINEVTFGEHLQNEDNPARVIKYKTLNSASLEEINTYLVNQANLMAPSIQKVKAKNIHMELDDLTYSTVYTEPMFDDDFISDPEPTPHESTLDEAPDLTLRQTLGTKDSVESSQAEDSMVPLDQPRPGGVHLIDTPEYSTNSQY